MPKQRKQLSNVDKELRRLKRNLKQNLRRNAKNNRPVRVGTDKKTGRPLTRSGKAGQHRRDQIARLNYQYQRDLALGLRQKSEHSFKVTANNMHFTSRKQEEQFFHMHNATAQHNQLMDRANSFRQSFRTRAEDIGVSKKVRDIFDERLGELDNTQLLQTLNFNSETKNLSFNEVFGSDQPFTDNQQLNQLMSMFQVLGIGDRINELSMDDINSGYVSNDNFTHFDFDQAQRKENRRSQGRV